MLRDALNDDGALITREGERAHAVNDGEGRSDAPLREIHDEPPFVTDDSEPASRRRGRRRDRREVGRQGHASTAPPFVVDRRQRLPLDEQEAAARPSGEHRVLLAAEFGDEDAASC